MMPSALGASHRGGVGRGKVTEINETIRHG